RCAKSFASADAAMPQSPVHPIVGSAPWRVMLLPTMSSAVAGGTAGVVELAAFGTEPQPASNSKARLARRFISSFHCFWCVGSIEHFNVSAFQPWAKGSQRGGAMRHLVAGGQDMSDVKDQVKSEAVDELSKFAKLALAFLMFMGSRRASRDLSASQVVSEFEH